jgi:hypothetical protein
MDIVDLGARDEPDDRPVRRVPRVRLEIVATVLLVAGFALAVASQLEPWFRITTTGGDQHFGADLGLTKHSVGMIDSDALVSLPYYLLWLLILVLCSAVVFSVGNRQRVLFGASAGALAAQAMLLAPVVHRPLLLISSDLDGDDDLTRLLKVSRAGGVYLALAALVVLAAAMVVAVRGRVLPVPERPAEDRALPARGSDVGGPAATGAAIAAGGGADGIAAAGAPGPAPESDPGAVPVDHSLYVRPTGDIPPAGDVRAVDYMRPAETVADGSGRASR